MSHVCWNGCSFTVGEGFPEDQRNHFVYRSLVDKHFEFSSDLLATGGASNYKIFMSSAQAVISGKYDIVFTQWSMLNRIWLYPGPDTSFFLNDAIKDYRYRDIYISPKDKQRLKDQLLILNHDYHNILDVIQYCNILENLSLSCRTKLVFINGCLPWNNDLNNNTVREDLEKCLSDYTKSILDFDRREDNEIINFFQQLQSKFSTLNQSLWVNIFDAMYKNIIDVGPEGHHPGVETHKWMYNIISKHLQEIE